MLKDLSTNSCKQKEEEIGVFFLIMKGFQTLDVECYTRNGVWKTHQMFFLVLVQGKPIKCVLA
jgi:hypothetical protein